MRGECGNCHLVFTTEQYLIEFRVHTRFRRHLSNFYLHDYSSVWVSSDNTRVAHSLAILEKFKSHPSFHYLGINFCTTNMGRYTTLSLPENDKVPRSSHWTLSRVKAPRQTNSAATRTPEHRHTFNPVN